MVNFDMKSNASWNKRCECHKWFWLKMKTLLRLCANMLMPVDILFYSLRHNDKEYQRGKTVRLFLWWWKGPHITTHFHFSQSVWVCVFVWPNQREEDKMWYLLSYYRPKALHTAIAMPMSNKRMLFFPFVS